MFEQEKQIIEQAWGAARTACRRGCARGDTPHRGGRRCGRAAMRRTRRRRAQPVAGQRVGQEGDNHVFPDSADAHHARRRVGVVRQNGAQTRLRASRRARRAAGRGALRRLYRSGGDTHALVCQYRRMGRHGHHGRYVGYGGFVRTDRLRRASERRRRHRRGVGTRAGRAGNHRGQLLQSARAR